MKKYIFWLYARIFARPLLFKLNYFIFKLSLSGLGILNYQTQKISGEAHFLKRALKIKHAPVVFDIGANIGDYAALVRSLAPQARILCFEPHPANIEKLRNRPALNALLVPKAVGSEHSTLQLFDYADNDGSSHASLYREVLEEIHASRVVSHDIEVITLDAYCKNNRIAHIDLLKVDVEGHEMAVLTGAREMIKNGKVDLIHFEFNEMNIISRVFMRDFRQILSNYDFFRLLPKGWVPLKGNALDEIFAYQNIVAIRNGCQIAV